MARGTTPVRRHVRDEPAFHVALSFAGEDRDYVEKTANVLRQMGFRVFYDKYERVTLWGKNLYDHLSLVYSKFSSFTVMFISKHYAKKLWTNHERQSAQARAFSERREYILPVRFDKTKIPGIHATLGYIDLADLSPRKLAEFIKEKIGPLTRDTFMPEDPDRLLILLGATTAAQKNQLSAIANAVFDDLCLMTRDERRLLWLLVVNTCPGGPAVDGDVHIHIGLLARLSGLTQRAILGTLSRLECLGFVHKLGSHNRRGPKNILRLTYEPLRDDDKLSGNWTWVVYGMFRFLEDNLCPNCRALALDHMDFSSTSSLAGIIDSHLTLEEMGRPTAAPSVVRRRKKR